VNKLSINEAPVEIQWMCLLLTTIEHTNNYDNETYLEKTLLT